jgi:hypothetical protein
MAYELLARSFKEGEVLYGLAKPLASAVDALAKLNHKRIKRMYLGFLQGRNSNVATADPARPI